MIKLHFQFLFYLFCTQFLNILKHLFIKNQYFFQSSHNHKIVNKNQIYINVLKE